MTQSDPELDGLLGATVGGKYRVDALLGQGGMGAVYQATNTSIGKRVALKFLYREAARDLDAVARFQREAEAASAVESAHIVQIFDSGTTDDGLPFLVMELLKGEDLRARLRREGRLAVRDAVHIAAQVARALRRAHEADIVHRDLKPDNIFLCHRDDDPTFVKIVDFGISKVSRKQATTSTLTRRGTVLGTAFYMAPEQAQAKRDVDGRADIFSLGAILFEVLAGRPPHVGTAYEAVLINICTQDAPDVREFAADVPASLASLIARALARDRGERFQSAGEIYDSLCAAHPEVASLNSVDRGHPTPEEAALVPVGAGTASGTAVKSDRMSPGSRRTLLGVLIAAIGVATLAMYLMASPPQASPGEVAESGLTVASAPAHSTVPGVTTETTDSTAVDVAAAPPLVEPGAPQQPARQSSQPLSSSAASALPTSPGTPGSVRHKLAQPRPSQPAPTTRSPNPPVGKQTINPKKGLELATTPE